MGNDAPDRLLIPFVLRVQSLEYANKALAGDTGRLPHVLFIIIITPLVRLGLMEYSGA